MKKCKVCGHRGPLDVFRWKEEAIWEDCKMGENMVDSFLYHAWDYLAAVTVLEKGLVPPKEFELEKLLEVYEKLPVEVKESFEGFGNCLKERLKVDALSALESYILQPIRAEDLEVDAIRKLPVHANPYVGRLSSALLYAKILGRGEEEAIRAFKREWSKVKDFMRGLAEETLQYAKKLGRVDEGITLNELLKRDEDFVEKVVYWWAFSSTTLTFKLTEKGLEFEGKTLRGLGDSPLVESWRREKLAELPVKYIADFVRGKDWGSWEGRHKFFKKDEIIKQARNKAKENIKFLETVYGLKFPLK